MDPRKLPFNALIVGPTNSGKTQYLLNQLRGPFRGKFDYIVLLCPTFVKNKTYKGFVDRDPNIFVIVCLQHEIEDWLRVASYFFSGTNTLFILDDCAASKDVKGRTGAACQSRIQRQARWNLRVGLNPADNQHLQAIPGPQGISFIMVLG